ncbi:hypothetical protein P2E20_11520, partial [Mannheimia haemolytica]|nr:hypothetical protein [Mannheimia haemolytica]
VFARDKSIFIAVKNNKAAHFVRFVLEGVVDYLLFQFHSLPQFIHRYKSTKITLIASQFTTVQAMAAFIGFWV